MYGHRDYLKGLGLNTNAKQDFPHWDVNLKTQSFIIKNISVVVFLTAMKKDLSAEAQSLSTSSVQIKIPITISFRSCVGVWLGKDRTEAIHGLSVLTYRHIVDCFPSPQAFVPTGSFRGNTEFAVTEGLLRQTGGWGGLSQTNPWGPPLP